MLIWRMTPVARRKMKMSLKVKGTDHVFSKNFGPGVIAVQTFEFDDKGASRTRIAAGLLDIEDKYIQENITVVTEEL